MIEIDEHKTIIADGYKISQKGGDGPQTVTLAGTFRQKQAYTEGMNWKATDPIRQIYAEDVKILGENYDVVIIARRKESGKQIDNTACVQ